MSKREIRALVKELQPIMRLERWKIEVSFVASLDEAHAQINRIGDYWEAKLDVGPQYKGWSKTKAREILAHELAHLIFSDIDNHVARLHDAWVPQAVQQFATQTYSSMLEAAVDWVSVIVSDGLS